MSSSFYLFKTLNLSLVYRKKVQYLIENTCVSVCRSCLNSATCVRPFLLKFDDANAAPESSVDHRAAQFPHIRVRIVDFARFQVRRAVESTYGHESSVNHGQANLFYKPDM